MPIKMILLVAAYALQFPCFGQDHSNSKTDLLPVDCASKVLGLLPDSLRLKMSFTLNDPERTDWYYIPHERRGLPVGAMDKTSYAATFELLRSCLSEAGYQKIVQISTLLEPMLKEMEKRKPEDRYRDAGKYYLSIFGTPSQGQIWGLRFEGHHVSSNFLLRGNNVIATTPFFLGSNPARVPAGPEKGKEVLHRSIADAFDLIHSLDAVQLKKARLSELAPVNSIEGHNIAFKMPEQAGIPMEELGPSQRKMLLQLMEDYFSNMNPEIGNLLFEQMKQSGDKRLWFSWKGGLSQGRLYYYRIQSPDILIEHDNTQNDGNHVHSLVRSQRGDFGHEYIK